MFGRVIFVLFGFVFRLREFFLVFFFCSSGLGVSWRGRGLVGEVFILFIVVFEG